MRRFVKYTLFCVCAVIAVYCAVYRFARPEMTDTQVTLALWPWEIACVGAFFGGVVLGGGR